MSKKEKEKFCEKLWLECEPQLRKICKYKLSNNLSEVDDVIADAYLALCDAVENESELENPKAWLYGTVNNLIKFKYTEIKKTSKTMISIDNGDYILVYNVDFTEARLTDETIEDIRIEIESELLPAELTLLKLLHEKKLTQKEVAVILNTTTSAVKQKNYRLKKKIKEIAKEKTSKNL